MTAWKRYTLSECCAIISGATPSTTVDAYWDGDVCWATPKDLSDLEGHYISDTPRKLTEVGLASCAATILPPNAVLFSSRAPIGHTAINTVPMATNQGFKSLIPHAELLDSKFLLHWLRKNRPYLEGLGVGATFKEVSKAIVSKVEISLPPLAEQRRIAAILDKADALRTMRREALTQLDRLAQSVFEKLFGDESPQERKPLHELCELITDGTHQTPTYADEGIIFLSAKNVTSGEIDWERIKYIPKALHLELHRRLAPKVGDILLAKNGTTGVAAVVDRDCIFDIYVSLALIRPRPDVLSKYLLAAINSSSCKKQFNGSLKGIGVPNLHLKEIRQALVPCPSLDEQREFVMRMDAIAKLKTNGRDSLAEAESLFASLQVRAFRGEL